MIDIDAIRAKMNYGYRGNIHDQAVIADLNVPFLCREVERLRKENEEMRKGVQNLIGIIDWLEIHYPDEMAAARDWKLKHPEGT